MKLTFKGALVGDVVYQKNTHRAAVIGRRDGTETFLAGGVPNLELHTLSIELDRPNLEINANGRDEGWREGVLAESKETA